MGLLRNLERRLERLIEGMGEHVFSGPLHPVELGTRLVRAADLGLAHTPDGPVAPNRFVVRVGPARSEDGDAEPGPARHAWDWPPGWVDELQDVVDATARARGWRLEGPVRVLAVADPSLPPGRVEIDTAFEPGPLDPWALLEGSGQRLPLLFYRTTIGRGSDVDVRLTDPRVSRRHARIWTEGGRTWIEDLGSANGTTVDGSPIAGPATLEPGSVVGVGPYRFAFRPLRQVLEEV